MEAIRTMLSFVSEIADASVFIGLKLHPQLTREITKNGTIPLPKKKMTQTGEWIEPQIVRKIYNEASRICPDYPLYQHTSCALSYILRRSNHTGTVYRKDICLPSHCPISQRQICESSHQIPNLKKN